MRVAGIAELAAWLLLPVVMGAWPRPGLSFPQEAQAVGGCCQWIQLDCAGPAGFCVVAWRWVWGPSSVSGAVFLLVGVLAQYPGGLSELVPVRWRRRLVA